MTFSICIRTIIRPVDYCRSVIMRLAETNSLCHTSVIGFHVQHGEFLTPNMNGVTALRLAAKDKADWILFLEDDIDIIDDFIGSVERWITKFAHPEILVYPLCSFYPEISRSFHKDGVWQISTDLYYGSQAILFRTQDALDYANWLAMRPEVETQFDLNIVHWHANRRPKVTVFISPAPCFVDHIGKESLMGTWERTGSVQDFAGRQWSYHG